MNKRLLINYKKGKRLKKVTLVPDFILKIKGKRDASKGEKITQAYVNKLLDKCVTIENLEALTVERLLHSSREQAGLIIAKFKDLQGKLNDLPEMSEEDTAIKYRKNRRTQITRQNIIEEIQKCKELLTQIFELINDVNTALELRVSRLRSHCSYKVDAYLIGVKEKDNKFSIDVNFVGKAIEQYLANHKKLDNAINNIVTSIYFEEDDDGEV